ncbi:LacI family DNA-binding transcriptional regulator [Rugosimonospora africana]|uniref:LacI family transcriptional regulator n=1 Tax=Rugosimonospora africana TaxID=556532 RepID=A0A8J3QV75_9ACTN|nr:LacI family DNA-binding transcriptional regulator [Rugosimonospora africana]GIH16415.1 LacI family transcriptional regulator [Rugosimonospora africana]
MRDATPERPAGAGQGRPPTIKDVAALAGVHPATASRALSGARTVSPELVRAVQRAARKLNYRVNPIGRALKQGASGTVGMVVPDIENPFFPALVRAVESALHREGLGLFLCDANNSVRIEAERLDELLLRHVDGLIISPVDAERSAEAVRAAAGRVPVVQVDRTVDVSTDAVAVDQHGMMEAVVGHLRASGRQRFAFITSGEANSPSIERLAAYRRVFAGDPGALARVQVGDLTLEWGAKAAGTLLSGGEPLPDALICANDLIAIGAMQTLRRAGVRVPEDVAIVGVDDTPFARVAEPPLTTVAQPVGQIGDEAVRMLLTRKREPHLAPRRLTLAGQLVARDSTPSQLKLRHS